MTAKYLVRCALPAGDSVRIQDYTDALVSLSGEIGFAPEWAEAAFYGNLFITTYRMSKGST